MKKRGFAALLAAVLALSLAVPVGAAVPGADLPENLLEENAEAVQLPADTFAFQGAYVATANEETDLLLGGFVVGTLGDYVLMVTTPFSVGSGESCQVAFCLDGDMQSADAAYLWGDANWCLIAAAAGDVPGGVLAMTLAPQSSLSGGTEVIRVGMGSVDGGIGWELTDGQVAAGGAPSGLYEVSPAAVCYPQLGGPVVTNDGAAVGMSAIYVQDAEVVSIGYVVPMDPVIAKLDELGATYQTTSGVVTGSGAGSSSGSGSGGSSNSGGSGTSSGGSGTSSGGSGSNSGGSGTSSGTSSGGSGSSSGSNSGSSGGSSSGGGGLLGDALSGGLIGIVAAAAAGAFLALRRKKKGGGTPSGVQSVQQPVQPVQQPIQPIQPIQPTSPVNGGVFQTPPSAALAGRGGMMNGRRFPIQGGVLALGRDPSRCGVVYPNGAPGVSALHCQVVNQNGAWTLADLGSTYGTFLNGQKLQPSVPYPLKPGDSFYLGQPDNTFVFEGG